MLLEVQGTFNQKTCNLGVIFRACVVTARPKKNRENPLICMDLRTIMKQKKKCTKLFPLSSEPVQVASVMEDLTDNETYAKIICKISFTD